MKLQRRRIFFLVFVASGFSGLIYESIWTHYLKLFLGHAAYAQTLVLAIFMGGLTIGSWICSKWTDRWSEPFRGYAYAEAAVGVLALAFHPVFVAATEYAYTMVLPNMTSPTAVNMVKGTVAALLILPQTILLGMTFPLMSAALLRRYPDAPGKTVAMLYFTNSIGAAAGVLASGFVLVRIAGLPGTITIAGCLNIILAAAVWILSRTADAERRIGDAPLLPPDGTAERTWYWYLLLASLATGAASFVYEIGWIRMLSLVMGSTTHSFEIMLAAFILGLALGGFWLQRHIDNMTAPVRSLVIVQIAMGILALATLPLYEQSFSVMPWLMETLPKTDTGYLLFNLSSTAIALSVMLPATVCAGMTLPLITAILLRKGHGERSIGAVYAMNTIGAIIGVFAAIHVGMPQLGLKGLITAGASLDMALGLLLFLGIRRSVGVAWVAGTAAACIGVVIVVLFFVTFDTYKMASGVYRSGILLQPGSSRVLYHRDGKTSTVSVTDIYGKQGVTRSIRTNGKSDAGVNIDIPHRAVKDETTMILAAALPLLHHPEAATAANIGLGSGLTTHTLLCDPRLTAVDTIEIEREIVKAATLFGAESELAYTDPRSTIVIDDAKTFFASHNKRYDIIISEPSNPWISGVAGLFSEEFYRLIRRHLADEGVFVQWVQMYEIDLELVASVFKAIERHFSDYVVYSATSGDLIIVARSSGSVRRPDPFVFSVPRFAEQLRKVYVASPQDIEMRRIGDRRMLERFFGTFRFPANSDYFPVLDQYAGRARFLGANALDMIRLGSEPLPLVDMLSSFAGDRSRAQVTPSAFHPKSQYINTAEALRDYYLRQGQPSTRNRIDAKTLFAAEGMAEIFAGSRHMEGPYRREVLFTTGINMIPYLSKDEAQAVWKRLESGPGTKRLSLLERKYISLFKAIGERDGAGMAENAAYLLEQEQDITATRRMYVIAAAMLGNLAQGSGVEAEKVWQRYRNRIPVYAQQDFLFQFLAAGVPDTQ